MEAGADRDAMERALGDVFSVTDRIVEFQQELRSRLAKEFFQDKFDILARQLQLRQTTITTAAGAGSPVTAATPQQQLHVAVLVQGAVQDITCTSLMTVLDMKKKIEDAVGLPTFEQRLTYDGATMDDNAILASFNLTKDDIIIVERSISVF